MSTHTWIMDETDTVANYVTQQLLEDESVSFASYKRCHFLEKKQTCEIVVTTTKPLSLLMEQTKTKLLTELTEIETLFSKVTNF